MAPDQTDRILDAVNELQEKLDKVRDDFHASLAQGRTENAQAVAAVVAQALINKDHTERIYGDGQQGILRDIVDNAAAIDKLIARWDNLSLITSNQTRAWNRLTAAVIGLALTVIGGLALLVLRGGPVR